MNKRHKVYETNSLNYICEISGNIIVPLKNIVKISGLGIIQTHKTQQYDKMRKFKAHYSVIEP